MNKDEIILSYVVACDELCKHRSVYGQSLLFEMQTFGYQERKAKWQEWKLSRLQHIKQLLRCLCISMVKGKRTFKSKILIMFLQIIYQL